MFALYYNCVIRRHIDVTGCGVAQKPDDVVFVVTPPSNAAIFRLVCKTENSDYQLRRVVSCHVMSCLSARPSVPPSAWNPVSTRRIFIKFGMSIFRKSVQKIKLPLKPDKNTGQST